MGLRCDSMVLMCWVGSFIKHKFDVMSKEPMKYQEKLLNKILEAGRNTEYGKKHNFQEIKNIEDYQKMSLYLHMMIMLLTLKECTMEKRTF